jgi:ABC-type transporter MlaC component
MAAAGSDETKARDYVVSLHDKLIALYTTCADNDCRTAMIRDMVSVEVFADRIAADIAGDDYSGLSVEAKRAYGEAVRGFIADELSGELCDAFITDIEAVGTKTTEDGAVLVATRVTQKYNDSKRRYEWMVRPAADGTLKVVDLSEAGYSLVEYYYDDLYALYEDNAGPQQQAQSTGTVAGMLKNLKVLINAE